MPSKTAKTPDIEQEMADISERIAALELEREALAAAPPPEWDTLTELGTEQLIQQEQRRLVVPQLLRAARIKLLELRRQSHQLGLRPVEVELEEDYAAYEEAEAKLVKAREERDAAHQQWNNTLDAAERIRRRIGNLGREIGELRGSSS